MDMVERGGQTAMGVTPRRSGRRVWFRGRIPEVRTRGYSRTRRADGDGSDTSPVGTSSILMRKTRKEGKRTVPRTEND